MTLAANLGWQKDSIKNNFPIEMKPDEKQSVINEFLIHNSQFLSAYREPNL